MKKITNIFLACFMFLINTVPIHAASGVDYGDTYTLKGSISNTVIQGTATGANSSNVNIDVEEAKYFNGRQTLTASSKSAMTYIYYYGTSLTNFERWKSAKIIGSVSNTDFTEVNLENY